MLQVDDLSVRASIKVSYDSFEADPRRHPLAQIGRLAFVDLTKPVLDSLLYGGDEPTDHVIAKLVEQQLILPTANGRYGIHDLVRDFAMEQGRRNESKAAVDEPVYRVLDYYFATAAKAHRLLYSGSADAIDHTPSHPVQIDLTDAESALNWIGSELFNIISVVRQAKALEAPSASLAVSLMAILRFPLLDMVGRWNELRELSRLAISIARDVRDLPGEGDAWHGFAIASNALDMHDEAVDAASTAVRIFSDLADAKGEAHAQLGLSLAYRRKSEYALAVRCLERGITLCQTAGLPKLEANLLDNLGTHYQRMERFDQAVDHHERGLKIRLNQDYKLGVAASHENLGWCLLRAGQPQQAIGHLKAAAKLAAEVSYFTLQAGALWGLGNAERQQGNSRAARQAWRDSIAIYRRLELMDETEATQLLAADEPEMPGALHALSD